MSRSIVLSNSGLCVALDSHAMVRDLYYPHVGLENHLRGHYIHRVGVWADGRVSWLSDGEWEMGVALEDDALVSAITARHPGLGVELTFSDTICSDAAIFLRHVKVKNTFDYAREIKLYFSHQFEIQKMHGSDTAYFDPSTHSIIHYKGKRVFLIGGELEGESFNDFATGRAHFQGREGSHRDAEDGELSKNPIEHGPADSIIGFYAFYAAAQERTCRYWLLAAQSIPDVHVLHEFLTRKTSERLLNQTREYWSEWLKKCDRGFGDLSAEHIALYKRSLMYARAHVDHEGGIIASVDSEMFQYGLDTYSYVWTRDAAYVALALGRAGDTEAARKFFEFCKEVITKEGYFMHKYLPDKSLGSSWHPWIANGRPQLPIQEDETAIVIYALYEYMQKHNDLSLLESVYPSLVESAADFLITYRDSATKLPLPSYDLWERKRGTSTYTASTVYGGLNAAAELSRMLGKEKQALRFAKAAKETHQSILKHLWREDAGMFCNMVNAELGPPIYDATIDISSVYGVFLFGVLPPSEMRLIRAFEASVHRLSEGVSVGGIARFENDDYYRMPGASTGNPWFLTTLWYAEYLIAVATTQNDLRKARDILTWTTRFALPSGILSEQLDPGNGNQVCAGPLAWSHAAYVTVVMKYCDRFFALEPKVQ